VKALIVILVLAVVVAGVLLLRRRSGGQSDPARAEVRAADQAVKEARSSHERAVRQAQKGLRAAEKARDSEVSRRRKELDGLQDPKGRRVASFHGVTLHERWLTTPHGEGPVAGTNASVDSMVSSRITATRLVAMGVFAVAKKKKTGTVYLSIDNPAFASVVECEPGEDGAARDFAAKVTTAARQAALEEGSRPQRIEEAQRALHAASASPDVDEARAGLQRVEQDEGARAGSRRRNERRPRFAAGTYDHRGRPAVGWAWSGGGATS